VEECSSPFLEWETMGVTGWEGGQGECQSCVLDMLAFRCQMEMLHRQSVGSNSEERPRLTLDIGVFSVCLRGLSSYETKGNPLGSTYRLQGSNR
jgi:hypothetical protein